MAYELHNSLPDPVQADTEEDETEYDVEAILKARLQANSYGDTTIIGSKTIPGRWDYFVKWAGYPDSANTWEPPKHLKKCGRLIKEFWDDSFEFSELTLDDIGDESDDDTIVHASEDWIEFQKLYFAYRCERTMEEVDDTPMVTTIDNTPLVEEEYDPHAEPGSDSEDEDDSEAESGREDEDGNDRQWNHLLFQKPLEATPEPAGHHEDYLNAYPSPMSIDNGDNDLTDLSSVYDIQTYY